MLQLVKHASLVDPIARRKAYLLALPPPFAPIPPHNPVPRLPTELLIEIINQLDSSTFDWATETWTETDEEPWQDLAACALASKSLLGAARERLYRKITITIVGPEVKRVRTPTFRSFARSSSSHPILKVFFEHSPSAPTSPLSLAISS